MNDLIQMYDYYVSEWEQYYLSADEGEYAYARQCKILARKILRTIESAVQSLKRAENREESRKVY